MRSSEMGRLVRGGICCCGLVGMLRCYVQELGLVSALADMDGGAQG